MNKELAKLMAEKAMADVRIQQMKKRMDSMQKKIDRLLYGE